MPQVNEQGIDVSKEEERYLRRAFRRFAFPYVAALAALAWFAPSFSEKDDGAAPSFEAVQQQIQGIEQSVAALQGRVEAIGTEAASAAKRVRGLEGKKNSAPPGDLVALEDELRRVSRRIQEIEARRKEEAITERIEALSMRMNRIEGRVNAPAAAQP